MDQKDVLKNVYEVDWELGCWYDIAMSPWVGWNRKGLETIYDMCVGPAMTLHTCET